MTETVPARSVPASSVASAHATALRVAAYVICVREEQLLLARFSARGEPHWTLPGGGIDHAEHPYDAAVREVAEETGYQVAIERLLGIGSQRRVLQHDEPPIELHTVQFFYSARITGGELAHEVGGSTDRAAWFDLATVRTVPRAAFVDVGLAYLDQRPVDGLIPAARDIAAPADNILRPDHILRSDGPIRPSQATASS